MSFSKPPHFKSASARLKDEQAASNRHTVRISDRKLLDIRTKLETLRRLNDTFAQLDLSPQAKRRLEILDAMFGHLQVDPECKSAEQLAEATATGT